jgi:diguanylate cyclase
VSLDLRTITLFAALLSLAQLLVPLFYARVAPHYRGIFHWGIGTLCSVAGFILSAGRGVLPDFFSIVVANTLFVMMACFHYSGCRLFVHRPLPRQWLYLAPLMTALFMGYFTYVQDNTTLRSLYFSFVIGSLMIHCALELRRVPDPRLRLSYHFTATVSALYAGMLLLVRIPLLYLYPVESVFTPTPTQSFIMVGSVMAGVLWTMGFAFMITQRMVLELNRTANQDFLTETLNRRAAQEHVNQALEQSRQSHVPLSVLLLDIDHFKEINDRYGHEVGDQVLVSIAALLRQHVRGHDMVARWGGEEFLILLRATGAPTALAVAERLIRVISATPIHIGTTTIFCNVSIGIATTTTDPTTSATLIRSADHAMYHAKRTGRNRAIAHEEQPLLTMIS